MKNEICQKALSLGFDDCRITSAAAPGSSDHFRNWIAEGKHGAMGYLEKNAHKRVEPNLVLPGIKSIITLATSYHRDAPQPLETTKASSGIIARYARFTDYHNVLGEKLKTLSQFVQQLGGEESRCLWYVDTGPLLERDLAQRAGLGFVGKHTNLISRRLGNWTFLSEILTSLALEPDQPETNHCGSCSRCLTACPTNAITAPFELDARRCISYLTIELKGSIPVELRPLIGTRIYGCDDCLAVCPWNRFAREGRLMSEHTRKDLDAQDMLELLRLDDDGFKAKFRDSPILRTKRRGLLRNVAVALGNAGDPAVLPHLEKAAADQEPLIAEHARWAIEEIENKHRTDRP